MTPDPKRNDRNKNNWGRQLFLTEVDNLTLQRDLKNSGRKWPLRHKDTEKIIKMRM